MSGCSTYKKFKASLLRQNSLDLHRWERLPHTESRSRPILVEICVALCDTTAASVDSEKLASTWGKTVSSLADSYAGLVAAKAFTLTRWLALAEKQKNKKYAMNVDGDAHTELKGLL